MLASRSTFIDITLGKHIARRLNLLLLDNLILRKVVFSLLYSYKKQFCESSFTNVMCNIDVLKDFTG